MIDEKELLKVLDKWSVFWGKKTDGCSRLKWTTLLKVRALVEHFPKANEWVPCSERLPEKDGKCICTQDIYSLSNGKITRRMVESVEFYQGKWRRAKHLKVIAWQPLPETYQS